MKTDFEIAHEAKLELIDSIAKKVNIPVEELEPFGKHIAKVPYRLIDDEKVKKIKVDSCYCHHSNKGWYR